MRRIVRGMTAATMLIAVGGCATPVLVPGAADVKIVQDAAGVTGCTAVGNFRQPPGDFVDPRNTVIGLGGNAIFVTQKTIGIGAGPRTIVSGVVYRCPQ